MEDIKNKVKNLLKEEFDVNADKIENDNVSLLTGVIHLDPRQLVYFVICIEKIFDMKFSDHDFDNVEFYNLNGLCNIISTYCTNK